MATKEERIRKYQDKIRELSKRYTAMNKLFRRRQKLENVKKRFKGRKLTSKEKLRHRENIEELEAQIAQLKESSEITVIIDPKRIKAQIDKIRETMRKMR